MKKLKELGIILLVLVFLAGVFVVAEKARAQPNGIVLHANLICNSVDKIKLFMREGPEKDPAKVPLIKTHIKNGDCYASTVPFNFVVPGLDISKSVIETHTDLDGLNYIIVGFANGQLGFSIILEKYYNQILEMGKQKEDEIKDSAFTPV